MQAGLRICCSQATNQGFLHQGPYDVEAQTSCPLPGYAPDKLKSWKLIGLKFGRSVVHKNVQYKGLF